MKLLNISASLSLMLFIFGFQAILCGVLWTDVEVARTNVWHNALDTYARPESYVDTPLEECIIVDYGTVLGSMATKQLQINATSSEINTQCKIWQKDYIEGRISKYDVQIDDPVRFKGQFNLLCPLLLDTRVTYTEYARAILFADVINIISASANNCGVTIRPSLTMRRKYSECWVSDTGARGSYAAPEISPLHMNSARPETGLRMYQIDPHVESGLCIKGFPGRVISVTKQIRSKRLGKKSKFYGVESITTAWMQRAAHSNIGVGMLGYLLQFSARRQNFVEIINNAVIAHVVDPNYEGRHKHTPLPMPQPSSLIKLRTSSDL